MPKYPRLVGEGARKKPYSKATVIPPSTVSIQQPLEPDEQTRLNFELQKTPPSDDSWLKKPPSDEHIVHVFHRHQIPIEASNRDELHAQVYDALGTHSGEQTADANAASFFGELVGKGLHEVSRGFLSNMRGGHFQLAKMFYDAMKGPLASISQAINRAPLVAAEKAADSATDTFGTKMKELTGDTTGTTDAAVSTAKQGIHDFMESHYDSLREMTGLGLESKGNSDDVPFPPKHYAPVLFQMAAATSHSAAHQILHEHVQTYGGGIFSYVGRAAKSAWNKITNVTKKAASTAKNITSRVSTGVQALATGAKRFDFGPDARALLQNVGDSPVFSMEVARYPVQKFASAIVNTVSYGAVNKLTKEKGWGSMWHLFLILRIADQEYELGKEANVVFRKFDRSIRERSGFASMELALSADHVLTPRILIDGGLRTMGRDMFYLYDGKDNNCQRWCLNMLGAAHAGGYVAFDWPTVDAFVYQDLSKVWSSAHHSVPTVFRKITDLAHTLDVAVHGEGFDPQNLSELKHYIETHRRDHRTDHLSGGAVRLMQHIFQKVPPISNASVTNWKRLAHAPNAASFLRNMSIINRDGGFESESGFKYPVAHIITGLRSTPKSDQFHFVDYKGLSNDQNCLGITDHLPLARTMHVPSTPQTGASKESHLALAKLAQKLQAPVSLQPSHTSHSELRFTHNYPLIDRMGGSWLNIDSTDRALDHKLYNANLVSNEERSKMQHYDGHFIARNAAHNPSISVVTYDKGGNFYHIGQHGLTDAHEQHYPHGSLPATTVGGQLQKMYEPHLGQQLIYRHYQFMHGSEPGADSMTFPLIHRASLLLGKGFSSFLEPTPSLETRLRQHFSKPKAALQSFKAMRTRLMSSTRPKTTGINPVRKRPLVPPSQGKRVSTRSLTGGSADNPNAMDLLGFLAEPVTEDMFGMGMSCPDIEGLGSWWCEDVGSSEGKPNWSGSWSGGSLGGLWEHIKAKLGSLFLKHHPVTRYLHHAGQTAHDRWQHSGRLPTGSGMSGGGVVDDILGFVEDLTGGDLPSKRVRHDHGYKSTGGGIPFGSAQSTTGAGFLEFLEELTGGEFSEVHRLMDYGFLPSSQDQQLSGGWFGHLKKAFNVVAPVVNPIVHSVVKPILQSIPKPLLQVGLHVLAPELAVPLDLVQAATGVDVLGKVTGQEDPDPEDAVAAPTATESDPTRQSVYSEDDVRKLLSQVRDQYQSQVNALRKPRATKTVTPITRTIQTSDPPAGSARGPLLSTVADVDQSGLPPGVARGPSTIT